MRRTCTTSASVVGYRPAFSQRDAVWKVRFTLDALGTTQGLFSYDESYQATAGHTSLDVLADGRLQLRHQDGERDSIRLTSRSAVSAGVEQEAVVTIAKGRLLALDVNGLREAESEFAFGTDETRRDLVIGATCAYCKPGTTSPLRNKISGQVQLTIESLAGSPEGDVQQPDTAPAETEADPAAEEPAPQPAPIESAADPSDQTD